MLQSAEGGKGSVVINRDDTGLLCSEVGGIEKLSARPLRAVFAGLLGKKMQTVSCLDNKNSWCATTPMSRSTAMC